MIARKMIAPSSGWPTREIALLIAEPRPEDRAGMERMSVVVSGATTHEIPTPKRSIDGRISISESIGGIRRAGSSPAASHGGRVDRDAGEPQETGGHEQRARQRNRRRP